MLFNLYTVDWRTYYYLIYFPVSHVKHSTPVFSTLLNLVTKYYSLSTNLPPTQKKWVSQHITKFNTWNLAELQKWLRIAKKIIQKDNFKRKKTLNTVVSTTKVSRYVYKIIPATDIQIIANRNLTSITAYQRQPTTQYIKDNQQRNAFRDNNDFAKQTKKVITYK